MLCLDNVIVELKSQALVLRVLFGKLRVKAFVVYDFSFPFNSIFCPVHQAYRKIKRKELKRQKSGMSITSILLHRKP